MYIVCICIYEAFTNDWIYLAIYIGDNSYSHSTSTLGFELSISYSNPTFLLLYHPLSSIMNKYPSGAHCWSGAACSKEVVPRTHHSWPAFFILQACALFWAYPDCEYEAGDEWTVVCLELFLQHASKV